MSRIILLVCAAAILLPAQTSKKRPTQKKPAQEKPAPAPVVFPIEAVRVEGNRIYGAAEIVEFTGLKPGQPADPKAFEQAQQRLVELEIFGSVSYRYEPAPGRSAYTVTFEVAEVEQIFKYRFNRLLVKDEVLREYLKRALPLFGDRIPATPGVIARFRAAIEGCLKENGSPLAVQGKVTAEGPGEMFVLFSPAGLAPVVAEVYFRGNSVLPAALLQNKIAGVAIGVEFREDRFRELLETSIRTLYEDRGRVRVSFPKIEAAEAKSAKGIAVTVEVAEGAAYNIGAVNVQGTQTMDRDLVKVTGLKSGDLAGLSSVQAAAERLRERMRAGGYMKTTVKWDRTVDDAKKEVNLLYRVDPGPQYKFGKLMLKGLDIHSEAAVRRLWGMDSNKPFNASYPDYFFNRLREENIFENLGKTRAVLDTDDKTLIVNVTLEFSGEERKPRGILR